MKRAIQSHYRRIIAAALLAIILSGFACPTQAATAIEKKAFNILTSTLGLSPAAACGIMGNIKAETDFRSDIVGMGGSYGICQWLGPRLSALHSFCRSNGYDASTLRGQLYYMKHELDTIFPRVGEYLKKVPNTAQGAYDAGYYFCFYYEIPADRYGASYYRASVAKNTYWQELGTVTPWLRVENAAEGLKLTWSMSRPAPCAVKRSWKSGGPWTDLGKTAAGKTTFIDKTAPAGKTYYYKVCPLDASGQETAVSNLAHETRIGVISETTASVTLGKTSLFYNGRPRKPSVTLKVGGKTLVRGEDFTVKYLDNINAGTATVKIKGKGNYTGSCTASFEIKKAAQKLTVKDLFLRYRNGTKTIDTGAVGKVKLIPANEEVVTASGAVLTFKTTGRTTITVKASATGNYKAAKAVFTLTVLPAPPVWKSIVKKSAKAAVLTWQTVPKCYGYEIQYNQGNSFAGAQKTVVRKAGTSSIELPLPARGTWIFRIRSYRTFEGKKLYSKWSENKTVRF